jgi:hypothetical protein
MASTNSSDLVKAMEGTTCNYVNQSSQASLTISDSLRFRRDVDSQCGRDYARNGHVFDSWINAGLLAGEKFKVDRIGTIKKRFTSLAYQLEGSGN